MKVMMAMLVIASSVVALDYGLEAGFGLAGSKCEWFEAENIVVPYLGVFTQASLLRVQLAYTQQGFSEQGFEWRQQAIEFGGSVRYDIDRYSMGLGPWVSYAFQSGDGYYADYWDWGANLYLSVNIGPEVRLEYQHDLGDPYGTGIHHLRVTRLVVGVQL